LVATKLMTSFGATKPQAKTEYWDEINSWNVGKSSNLDAAICPRKFHWILSSRELRDFKIRNVYIWMGGLRFLTFKNILLCMYIYIITTRPQELISHNVTKIF
jgi:hypothetical protein